jgi:hypothetical protein
MSRPNVVLIERMAVGAGFVQLLASIGVAGGTGGRRPPGERAESGEDEGDASALALTPALSRKRERGRSPFSRNREKVAARSAAG